MRILMLASPYACPEQSIRKGKSCKTILNNILTRTISITKKTRLLLSNPQPHGQVYSRYANWLKVGLLLMYAS